MSHFLDFCSDKTYNRDHAAYLAWVRRFHAALLSGKLNHLVTVSQRREFLLTTYSILGITRVPMWGIQLNQG